MSWLLHSWRRIGGARASTEWASAGRAAALVAALPFVSAWTVTGTVVVDTYYPIAGSTHAELVASVKSNGPRNGKAYGIGFIDFHPRFDLKGGDGKCRIGKVEVGLRAAIRLPRWAGAPGAPKSVVRSAARFERAIRAHEMQHVAIAKRYAATMRIALAKLAPETDCWRLRERADALIARLKKSHIASQRVFDLRTNAGIRRLL